MNFKSTCHLFKMFPNVGSISSKYNTVTLSYQISILDSTSTSDSV